MWVDPLMTKNRWLGAMAVAALVLGAPLSGCPGDGPGPEPDAQLDAGADAGDGDVADTGVDAGDGDVADTGVDGGPPPDCIEATGSGSASTGTWTDLTPPSTTHTATVTVSGPPCGRTFNHGTTQPLLDPGVLSNPRTYNEHSDWPSISTNNDLFDALYALALEEVRENSVNSIVDGAYNGGNPIPCPTGGCFETGRLWTFVWTRDTAYAVDLALAALDPTRARNSLEFKLSDQRGGGSPQIIQDTGTGGSYPVSSDRAVWAVGAWQLIKFLDGVERQDFIARAAVAVRNTIEHDRQVVWDAEHGLYQGEQSFLDWREQTYPAWTATDTVQIAMSQSLSTNVGHLRLLQLGAWLAGQQGDTAGETQLGGWASDLAVAIDTTFFHAGYGLWGTFTTGFLDRAPVQHFDLLGSALAVTGGVGDAARHAEVVRSYPMLSKGPAVIWPQQKDIPIYHNRGQWPFVTAYWLRAARQVRNDAAVSHNVRSLIRGAAMNLSNMENFEAVTGQPYLAEGATSGPVVNSQRQLWSVAGYLSMVHDVIFGLDAAPDGIRFLPYITRALRNDLFAGADSLVWNDFPYRGSTITVVVHLPPTSGDNAGAYSVGEIRLDGQVVTTDYLAPAQLLGHSVVEITLDDTPEAADTITLQADTSDYRTVFAPATPTITNLGVSADRLVVSFAGGGEPASEIQFNVYRDGVQVASGLPGSTTSWTDPASADHSVQTYCYTVEAQFVTTGVSTHANASQHAKPSCYWGPGYERIGSIGAASFVSNGGTLILQYGKQHYQGWGDAGHTLVVSGYSPGFTGDHLLQVNYGNGAGPFSTGITCVVKRIEVMDQATSNVVASGVLVMPHLATWDRWADSNFVKVSLSSASTYTITIFHDATTLNMSDFEHNAVYAGTGGSSGAFHNVNIAELKILSLTSNP